MLMYTLVETAVLLNSLLQGNWLLVNPGAINSQFFNFSCVHITNWVSAWYHLTYLVRVYLSRNWFDFVGSSVSFVDFTFF